MTTYTRPTIESVGGGGHEADKPIWFYFLVAVTAIVAAAVACVVIFLVDSPAPESLSGA